MISGLQIKFWNVPSEILVKKAEKSKALQKRKRARAEKNKAEYYISISSMQNILECVTNVARTVKPLQKGKELGN